MASVILGVDFCMRMGWCLTLLKHQSKSARPQLGSCSITPLLETPIDAVDECAVPDFWKTSSVELPECVGSVSQPF